MRKKRERERRKRKRKNFQSLLQPEQTFVTQVWATGRQQKTSERREEGVVFQKEHHGINPQKLQEIKQSWTSSECSKWAFTWPTVAFQKDRNQIAFYLLHDHSTKPQKQSGKCLQYEPTYSYSVSHPYPTWAPGELIENLSAKIRLAQAFVWWGRGMHWGLNSRSYTPPDTLCHQAVFPALTFHCS